MVANTREREFDVVEVTNEMPWNRLGGVGTVIENLMSGLAATGTRALWFLVDHDYLDRDVERILARYDSVAVGTHADLARFDTPVLHLHSYAVNERLLDALAGRPIVFTIHSLLAEEERSNDVDLSGAVRWQEELIACCDRVVLISEAERAHYRRLGYERLNASVTVVHNGLRRPERFRSPRARETVGSCGRLVPRKHPEYVPLVLREPGFERCRALVAGKAFSVYARDLVGRLGVEERVRYLGWCGGERLEAFYASIDVLALPSVYEPFGMVALEAAARGVPVVCTRVDGLVEVLGEHAFYVADDSYEGFRDGMRRWLAAGDDELSAVAEGAFARYVERYTDVAMATAYGDVFGAVAS